MSSDVEGLDLEALEKVAREATPGPWMKEVSVHSNGMLDAHFAVRTVDKHPDHPWSPRFITFMTGTLRSDLRVNDIKGAKYCRECEAWHLGWSREIGVDVRADAKCEADATFIATFDPPTVLHLLAALRAQDERVRVLETAVLDAAISDRLDEAGSPLSWREVAEAAERRAGEAEARVIAEMEYANSSRNIAARLHGALAEIARGDVPPEKEGHYHAHREAVRIARAALLPATQAEGE